ncbi:glycosyltransferase family protein [Hymenobacter sp. BT186]|uniref:Glycosyltransferase family protein n=1 Tax=Hymenobacter telluris TaxID=2816474 RepID=A0A939JAU7_9BACT|nr:glycosyltransferase family protein [Hymenobacter telluris]MBO0356620.1 glycosyltransferase family protein [Hymenobacter telluris]MBW3372645.1 glycosyltransferase family protein [Hymenobacter norwichensis]
MHSPRIGIITQARMGSTRLPGKVLRTIRGTSILEYHVRRLETSGLPVYIATTTLPADDAIVELARQLNIPCFRGEVDDVLSRYFATATHFGLDVVVRVTSDCPLLDGRLIGAEVQRYVAAADSHLYLSNGLIRTFPRGLDFEVFSYALLAEAQQHATSASDREHVTPYIHQNRSGQVHFAHAVREPDASRFRVTLDTAEDFQLLEVLLAQYHADALSADELIALLEAHPEVAAINAQIEQKKYDFS